MFHVSKRVLFAAGAAAVLLGVSPFFTYSRTVAQEATPEMTDMAMMMGTPTAEMQAVLDQYAAFEAPPIAETVPRIAREAPAINTDGVIATLASQGQGFIPEAVADVTHQIIPGAGEDILVRIYTPEGDGPFPVIVYLHGGGWVIANLNVYDAGPRALANAAGAVVVSVAYRQSPEYPFPTPVEDAYAATQWVFENAASFNGDPARIAIAGESAGGNMATVVTMMARDRGGNMPIHQLLVYPVTQLVDLNTPSYQTYAEAAPLNRAGAEWFFNYYVPNEADRSQAYASPLLAEDLSGLPSATIIAAQIDPLLSEGEDYANRLREAGIDVAYQLYEGVAHEFFGMGAVVPEGLEAVAFAAERLTAAFGS